MLLGIEGIAEAEIGEQRRRRRQGDAANKCQHRIDDDYRHFLMGREIGKRYPQRAVSFGDEVYQDKPPVGEEVEVAETFRAGRCSGRRGIGSRFRHARRWLAGPSKIISGLGILLERGRVVDRPGVEEEARPIDRRTCRGSGRATAEDVGDLIAEVPAADIRGGVCPLRIDPGLGSPDLRQIGKQVEVGHHPRGHHMDPRQGIGVFELDDEVVSGGGDPFDRCGRKPRRLQLPEAADIHRIDALSVSDPDHHAGLRSLHKELKIASRQILQDQIAIHHGKMLKAIDGKTAPPEFEQGNVLPRDYPGGQPPL